MTTKCKFWLPRKNRFCANSPLHDSLFCGNHTNRSDGQWIPCPIDPSHNVLRENLESHLKRCPLLKQERSLSLQPYYQKGINAGKEEEEVKDETLLSTSFKVSDYTSEMKRKAVYAMSVNEFSKLLSKIKSIHASICNDIRDSFKIPEACAVWTNRQVDRKLPFQEKHVLQQASILGNLEELGVLTTGHGEISSDGSYVAAVVEFGAGRGYLTQVLADCYGIKKVVLVERKSYKLKADRSLRQKESLTLERLRIDIEDLKLEALESLQGVPYLATGKHLCGPATDMTIRCCIPERCGQDMIAWSRASCDLRGLAVAACCHHLCQWKHYINKRYMTSIGLSKDDFHAITWFTSWAVDADHGSSLCGDDFPSNLQIMEKEESRGFNTESCRVEDMVRNMKGTDRGMLGFMCKDIIDAGRLMWLKEHGLECELVRYVPSSISPENHLLLARPGPARTDPAQAVILNPCE